MGWMALTLPRVLGVLGGGLFVVSDPEVVEAQARVGGPDLHGQGAHLGQVVRVQVGEEAGVAWSEERAGGMREEPARVAEWDGDESE